MPVPDQAPAAVTPTVDCARLDSGEINHCVSNGRQADSRHQISLDGARSWRLRLAGRRRR